MQLEAANCKRPYRKSQANAAVYALIWLTAAFFTTGEIARVFGCSTSSRFAELFKKSTGILPIEYRKIARRE